MSVNCVVICKNSKEHRFLAKTSGKEIIAIIQEIPPSRHPLEEREKQHSMIGMKCKKCGGDLQYDPRCEIS